MIPFDSAAFLALFGTYNAAIWPAQLVAYALGLLALAAALRPSRHGGRVVAAVLAAMWAWNGIAYHWLFFAGLNFLAPGFALAFVVQALLLAWSGLVRDRLAPARPRGLVGWAGLALALYGLAVYPLTNWLAGHTWPEMPVFGVAPCPTTIFTLGLLLLVRAPWWLFVVPLLWSVIGGSAAWLLGVPENLALPAAGLATLALLVVRR